jgi:xanthine dehydrogenase accessory factor
MRELLATLRAWQADGARIGRAVVLRTYGSAPRPEGSVLLYSADGRIAGSVSGGCVEGDAAEQIGRALESGLSRTVSYGVSDEQAWQVGLACGGTIDVLIEPDVADEVLAAASSDAGAVVITPLPADEPARPAPKLTNADAELGAELAAAATAALRQGRSRVVELDGAAYLVEAFPVRPRLVIVGAVEVARALVALARQLDFETIVIDGRAAFATRERFPDADRLMVEWPQEAAAQIGLGQDDFVAVLSHDPKFDEPAIVEALGCGCRYVGAIGSKKTQAARRDRLRAMGVTEADLERLRGPIGLELGGRAPAEIALAIMAEIVAARYEASGQPPARTRSR